ILRSTALPKQGNAQSDSAPTKDYRLAKKAQGYERRESVDVQHSAFDPSRFFPQPPRKREPDESRPKADCRAPRASFLCNSIHKTSVHLSRCATGCTQLIYKGSKA